jgi:hypothetical protein
MKDFNPVSRDYLALKPRWDLITALLGGSFAMRDAAHEHLPQHEAESTASYQSRLAGSVLAPFLEEAVDGVVSRVFAEPVILPDEAGDEFRDAADDITGLGENLDTFARRAFQSAVAYGVSWILVDSPQIAPEIEEEVDGKKIKRSRTLADDQREGVRPYWVLYPALNVPGVEIGRIGAKFGITRIRLAEVQSRVDPDTLEETTVERVRIITPAEWMVYERQTAEATSASEGKDWQVVEQGVNELGVVPVVPIALGRYDRPYVVKPPFLDLACINVRHWQSYSDQINVLTKSRFEMLAYSGDDQPVRYDAAGQPSQDGTIVVGPSTVLRGAANSKWYYVGPEGSGAEQGWKDLERLEQRMSELALLPFVAQKTGNATATAKAIDTTQANSEVQAWALILKDALEQAWRYHAAWINLEDGPAVEVNTDYGLTIGASDMADLIKMRALGELSQRTLWMEAKRRAVLGPAFDPETEEGNLASEGPAHGSAVDEEAAA